MPRIFFGTLAISCVLAFAPFGAAMQHSSTPLQQRIDHNDDGLIGNFCAPDFESEFDEGATHFALDQHILGKVRIELLERGFDPGFPDNRDNTVDAQLSEALLLFQYENNLPMTGHIDAPTLAALYLAIPEIESIS